MAKIVEEIVVIKFSKLVKEEDSEFGSMVGKTTEATLEQVAQELAGDGVIVEIIKE